MEREPPRKTHSIGTMTEEEEEEEEEKEEEEEPEEEELARWRAQAGRQRRTLVRASNEIQHLLESHRLMSMNPDRLIKLPCGLLLDMHQLLKWMSE